MSAFSQSSQVSEILLAFNSDIASITLSERLFVATMVSRGMGITMAIWGLDRVPGALIASV